MGQQGLDDVVGIGRLGHVIDGPGFYRRHRRGDIAIAGQHDDAAIGPRGVQGLDHFQAVPVLQAQIQHGKGRRVRLGDLLGLVHRPDCGHNEAAPCHGAPEPGAERGIVVENEQGLVVGKLVFDVAHASVLIRFGLCYPN